MRLLTAAIVLSLMASCGACRRNRLPTKDSPAYREYVRTFFIGLAALQAGDDARAKDSLQRATAMVPDEPSAWINLAILELKQKLYDPSAEHLEKARSMAPEVGSIYFLQGTLESARGNYDAAIKNYRRAIELDQNDLRSRYALAQELERQGGPAEGEAFALYQQVLIKAPNNTAAILEVARLAAKRGDAGALIDAISRLRPQSAAWPAEVKEQFAALETAAANPATAAAQVAFLRNVLLRLPAFRQGSFVLKLPPEIVAEPVSKFVKLAQPDPATAPPDLGLTYAAQPPITSEAYGAGTVQLQSDGPPIIYWRADGILHVGAEALPLPKENLGRGLAFRLAQFDINYDFRTDLVAVNSGGLRVFRQTDNGHFQDITATLKLPVAVTTGAYLSVWAADLDLDGDLDLLLAPVRPDAAPVSLQNNGDGTLTPVTYLTAIKSISHFAYGDLDGDGDPDIAAVDFANDLLLFSNQRGGIFVPWAGVNFSFITSIAIGDLDGDGRNDLVTLDHQGVVRRSTIDPTTNNFTTVEIAKLGWVPTDNWPVTSLMIADVDNNGRSDVVVTSFGVPPETTTLLGDHSGDYQRLTTPGSVHALADTDGDGLLDQVVRSGTQLTVALAKGTKNYHWQNVRPRAANAAGDQRINSFGVGGEMELRAGLLYQKQIIGGPVVHFGLGDQPAADVIRVVWPNGSVQAEFDMKPDQAIVTEQRLKGSCPHLFAWDGKQMRFIKDAPPWSPALGLKINAQTTAGIGQTEEWFTLPGDAVAPAADGMYDLRITAELWETFYIDRYSLLVVDHSVGTEALTDERFVIPAPQLKVRALEYLQPFQQAHDDNGTDVSATISALDEKYLDTFGRGQYQGVTRDHYVELEIPSEAHVDDDKLVLVGQGWLHPTDASINVAIGQGHNEPPRGLSIEVPDGRGGWRTAKANQGFPAGKMKNVVIDLAGVFTPGKPRIFRLRTNMEIYWDRLAWTVTWYDDQLKIQRFELSAAELTHRGFSVMTKADASSPEIPHYDQIETTGQKWRDLEGYYTRYGDVRELLAGVDGRFVLVNAGDEIRLRFPAPPPPPAGYVRDFVLIGNGWIKDGDLNSGYSRTVLPLPTLDMTEYTRAPTRLEDEPAYRAHPEDWRNYHTRYVAPDQFRNAMRLTQK